MKAAGIIAGVIVMMTASLSLSAGDLDNYKKNGHKSPQWTPLVEAGFSAYESGNRDAAINFFNRAIEKGCKDGLVYFTIAGYYEERDNLTNARKYLELAKIYLPQKYPNNEATKTINEHLGRVLFSMGDLLAAEAELARAASKQGPNFTVMFLLGSIARQKNDDRNVINYYTMALAAPPPPGVEVRDLLLTIMIEIAKANYNLKQYNESMDAWNRVLEIAPNHPIARQYKLKIEREKVGSTSDMDEQKMMEEIFK